MNVEIYSVLTLITVSITLAYSFYICPFRPHQFLLVSFMFSFGIRPLLTTYCDTFISFYRYSDDLYAQGTMLSLIYSFFLCTPVFLFSRFSKNSKKSIIIEQAELEIYLKFLLFLNILVVFVCLAIYGVAILPGVRTVGLSLAAPGSQVFYAIVSVITPLSIAIIVFLGLTHTFDKKLVICLIVTVGCAMVFNQRGNIIAGFFLGLYICAVFSRSRFFRNAGKKLFVLSIIVLVAMYARPAISYLISLLVQSDAVNSPLVYGNQSLACKISMTPNQEHDQVWPIALEYISIHGNNWFTNILHAFTRPFYSLDQREALGLLTVNDALNIFNDRFNYLVLNLGFSLPGMIYQYISIGPFFVVSGFLLFSLTVFLENKIEVQSYKSRTILKFYFLSVFVNFINGPIDDSLKWLVFSVFSVVILHCIFLCYLTLVNSLKKLRFLF